MSTGTQVGLRAASLLSFSLLLGALQSATAEQIRTYRAIQLKQSAVRERDARASGSNVAPLSTGAANKLAFQGQNAVEAQDLLDTSGDLWRKVGALQQEALQREPLVTRARIEGPEDDQRRMYDIEEVGRGNLSRSIHLQSPTPLFNYHFKFMHSMHEVARSNLSVATIITMREQNSDASAPVWAAGFVCSVILMLGLNALVVRRLAVELPVDEDLVKVRGRPFWVPLCLLIATCLSIALFGLTLVTTYEVNEDIRKDPVVYEYFDGENVTVTRSEIEDPGERAFDAGQGVVLSVIVSCLVLFSWRFSSAVEISASLFAQFALRGGTVSICVALILESTGLFAVGLARQRGFSPVRICTMLLVGFSEEIAKPVVLVCGLCLSVVSARRPAVGACARGFRVLVESKRALMLAGMAVGFGFMVVENAGYVMASAVTPAATYDAPSEPTEVEISEDMVSISTGVTILLRVLFNIHPWLSGITAGRIANVAFRNPSTPRVSALSTLDFMWAFLPSALTHAAYDFMELALPELLVLFLPPLYWFLARQFFRMEWDRAGQLEAVAPAPAIAEPEQEHKEDEL